MATDAERADAEDTILMSAAVVKAGQTQLGRSPVSPQLSFTNETVPDHSFICHAVSCADNLLNFEETNVSGDILVTAKLFLSRG